MDAIDRSRVVDVKVLDGERLVFSLHLDPGQRLIMRRRVWKRTDGWSRVCWLVGWQMTVNGANVQSIAYIFEDGEGVHLAGRFREDHPVFDAPVMRPFEVEGPGSPGGS